MTSSAATTFVCLASTAGIGFFDDLLCPAVPRHRIGDIGGRFLFTLKDN